MTLGIAIDVLVALLLVAAIGWAVVLDRRLRDLRTGKDGVRQAVGDLADAAVRAEAAVAALRLAAEKSGQELAAQQSRAHAASEELAMLVGAAETLANRLTASATASRTIVAPARDQVVRELRGAR